MAKKPKSDFQLIAENKKAYFHYEVLEKLECGLELQGTEVKSVRSGQLSFVDAFVEIKDQQLFLMKFHISPYAFGNLFNHAAERPRRLLAHKGEINRLYRRVREKGFTIIPLRIYFKKQYAKMEIGLCRGKKLYDKRETIKERDIQRQNDRDIRSAHKGY